MIIQRDCVNFSSERRLTTVQFLLHRGGKNGGSQVPLQSWCLEACFPVDNLQHLDLRNAIS